MELTRLAARLLWHIAVRSRDGRQVSRTTVHRLTGSAVSTDEMQNALNELLLAGLLVRGWGRQPASGPAATVYAITEKARAMELKHPRRGNPRTGQATATSVRLPAGLRMGLEAAADANDCALNAEIIRRLEASFKREKKNVYAMA